MKSFIATLINCFLLICVFGQSARDTIFLNENQKQIEDPSNAKFYRFSVKKGKKYFVEDYFIDSDKLSMTGSYLEKTWETKDGDFVFYAQDSLGYYLNKRVTYQNGFTNGLEQCYYPTGELYYSRSCQFGQYFGDFIVYYRDGSVKRKEITDQSGSKVNECYGPNGELIPFFPFEVAAEFPGGLTGLSVFVAENLNYPAEAEEKKIEGKVIVNFTIDETGKVSKIIVKKSVHQLLDQEAVRVVKSLPLFIPAERDGVKVKFYYSLPINFKL